MKIPNRKRAKHPYLSRVEITNFRNFESLALALRPTAVVVGENKVGKSNFLHALRLVLDPSLPDSARKLRAEDFWDGLGEPFAGNSIEIAVFIRDFDDNKGAKAVLSDCIVETSPLTAKLTFQFKPIHSVQSGGTEENSGEQSQLSEDDYDFVVFGGEDENNIVGGEVRKWLALILLPALRDAEGDIQNWRKSPLRPLLERVRKEIPIKKFEEVREDLDEAKAKLLEVEPVAKLVKAVNTRVRALAGPVHSVKTDLDFASSEPEQLLKALRVFLQGKSSKPLSDASLGTANILFLALLLQDLEMKQQAKEIVSTVLAIEEPEAHLHPQLQRSLFRYFLGRQHPILLTTHSPNIASVSPVESLVLLRDVGGNTKGFTPQELGLEKSELADLQRYLDTTRAEMLFARTVIFVEGPAEQFLIPAFAAASLQQKKLGSSLDEYGVSVCAVNGTDFAPFRRLLSKSGLAITNLVITDGDPRQFKEGVVRAGLQRGIRLLPEAEERDEVQAHLDSGEDGEACKSLAEQGVFVGEDTLEVDLLDGFSDAIKETYSELRGSEVASQKFNAAADGAHFDSAAKRDFLTRIEAIGKGRFAQRLASKVGETKPPSYIEQAIDYVISLIPSEDAESE